ncbi:Altered inheritance of mitochondria protein 6 [Microbotryomycetes sp. JL221]|nr:Altered inheritance of mitochondria protein 6 [Microbotryomycetes sp. JL221]
MWFEFKRQRRDWSSSLIDVLRGFINRSSGMNPLTLLLSAVLSVSTPTKLAQQILSNDVTGGTNQLGAHARGDWPIDASFSPYAGGHDAPELVFPGGLSRSVPARRIHSHNDYWRDTPLYSALAHGASSVEADVWLNPKDSKLYVGHSVSSLTRARTFDRLYVSQLVKVLSAANPHDKETVFFNETDYFSPDNEREIRKPWVPYWQSDSDTIQLLVDLKTRGDETYQAVSRELEPLRSRGWLTTRKGKDLVRGPVTVILTGNGANLDVRTKVASLDKIDMFIDAPLLSLDDVWTGDDGKSYTWDPRFAPLASTGYAMATSWKGIFAITRPDETKLKVILEKAQKRGFETRLWSSPRWPIFARDRVWRTLLDLGVDWLDADDLAAAAAL